MGGRAFCAAQRDQALACLAYTPIAGNTLDLAAVANGAGSRVAAQAAAAGAGLAASPNEGVRRGHQRAPRRDPSRRPDRNARLSQRDYPSDAGRFSCRPIRSIARVNAAPRTPSRRSRSTSLIAATSSAKALASPLAGAVPIARVSACPTAALRWRRPDLRPVSLARTVKFVCPTRFPALYGHRRGPFTAPQLVVKI